MGLGGGEDEGTAATPPAMVSDRWHVKSPAQLQNWLTSCSRGQEKAEGRQKAASFAADVCR